MLMLDLIGKVESPLPSAYQDLRTATNLLSNIIRLMTIGGGIYALINFVIAGIGFISAAGNPERVSAAWAKIYQSLIGLCVIALSFVFAGLLGTLLYGQWYAFLKPTITGPGG
jgi:hypothetical protein